MHSLQIAKIIGLFLQGDLIEHLLVIGFKLNVKIDTIRLRVWLQC